MTTAEAHEIKKLVYTLGQKSIVYGRRLAICESTGLDAESDFIANDVYADMVQIEQTIQTKLDKLAVAQ